MTVTGNGILESAVAVEPRAIDGPAGPLEARLYRAKPDAGTVETLLVFLHGGGFVDGGLDESDVCMRTLASRIDATVLAVEYSRAPEQPFPAAAEDAYAALVQCAAHPRRYGWTGRNLVVGGVEAGGNLAAVAALMARDRNGPPLAGQLLMMPMLDPGLTSGSMRCASAIGAGERIASQCAEAYRCYLPRAADRAHPYASPLIASRLKGLPPTLFVSITGDPLADEAEAYAAKLAAAGVPVETLRLQPPGDTESLIDATARCTAASDDRSYAAIAAFLSSLPLQVLR